tara:strand:- start:21472 stop:21696 length:225 start_codon:yes stop_codon:yes gene_type:complete
MADSHDSFRIAAALLEVEGMSDVFRAKNHKTSPMSDKVAELVASAQECEKRRIIEARIRKHTNSSFEDIFGEGK